MDRYTPPLVAVLGGGQLGRMLGLAGIPLGLGFRFLDPSSAAPAQSLGLLVVGALDDDVSLLKTVEARGRSSPTSGRASPPTRRACSRPAGTPSTRRRGRSRSPRTGWSRRRRSARSGIPVAEFANVETLRRPQHAAVDDRPARGVQDPPWWATTARARSSCATRASSKPAFAELREGRPLILEAMVPFERELSILAVRGRDGDVRVLAAGREPARRRDPAHVPRAGAEPRSDAAGHRRGLRPLAARGARLRRRARGRAVPGRRRAARQRDGAPRAQLGALDHRGRGHEPVREPPARDPRLAARRDRCPRRQRRW